MEKTEIKFLKDYSKVLKFSIKRECDVEDINEIILKSEYYKNYAYLINKEVDYQNAFLMFYSPKFQHLYRRLQNECEIKKDTTILKKLKL